MNPERINSQIPAAVISVPDTTHPVLATEATGDTVASPIPGPKTITLSKLILLGVFSTLYGLVVGVFDLGPRTGIEGYLANIPHIFSAFFFIIIVDLVIKSVELLWLFLIVGIRSKSKWLIAVPIIAYEFTNDAGILAPLRRSMNLDFFRYLSLHFLPQDASRTHLYDNRLLVPFVYIIAFLLVVGVYGSWTLRSGLVPRTLMMAIIPIAIAVSLISGVTAFGTTSYYAEQRKIDGIHLPNTKSIFSDGKNIIYGAMQHSAGVYQSNDDITFEKLYPSKLRSTAASCKGNLLKTKDGHAYTAFENVRYKSNNSKSGALGTYTDYTYCFVIGAFKYNLARSDGFDGPAYLQQYPVDTVIDTIAKAEPIAYACTGIDAKIEVRKTEYCDNSAINSAQALVKDAARRWSLACIGGRYSGTKLISTCESISTPGTVTAASAKATYTEIGRLPIPKFGISLPLSAEVKDMYLVPSETSALMFIGLRKYDSDTCFAGDRSLPGGGHETGLYIGGIGRENTAAIDALFKSTPGALHKNSGTAFTDGYTYDVYVADSNAADCGVQEQLDSIFDWMESGIKRL